jgi:hypothetical protein
MSVARALIFAVEAQRRFRKGFSRILAFSFAHDVDCPFTPVVNDREESVPLANGDFVDGDHFQVSQLRFAEYLQRVRHINTANHPFTNFEVASHITNRHHLSQIHNDPRKAVCVVAFWNHIQKNGVQHTIADTTFKTGSFNEEHRTIHADPWGIDHATHLTSPNQFAISTLGTSIAQCRSRHPQMKNTFFSPAGQWIV